MLKIHETLIKGHAIYTVQEYAGDKLFDSRIVNVRLIRGKRKNGKNVYILYDSQMEPIIGAYEYINEKKYISENTREYYATSLQYLYSYAEIIGKDAESFDRNDFLRLISFITGMPTESTDITMSLCGSRSSKTVGNYISAIRGYYEFMGIENSLTREDMTSYTPNWGYSQNLKATTAPIAVTESEFTKIISTIRNSNKSEILKLRDEIIVRLGYECGLRLGEALGLTFEDLIVKDCETIDGETISMCYIIIRNRLSDQDDQCAKRTMNIESKANYNSPDYITLNVGYQLAFASIDLYEAICEYWDKAHIAAKKKHTKAYKETIADAVDSCKRDNTENHYLFLNYTGGRLSARGFRDQLRKVFIACGLPVDRGKKKLGLFHRLRHGYVTRLVKRSQEMARKNGTGLNEKELMELSRHKSVSAFRIYYNPTAEELAMHQRNLEIKDDDIPKIVERLIEETDDE